jgi:hypothetical protein
MTQFKLLLLSFILTIPILPQSSIIYETGTTIEVSSGADICADNVTIQGIYTGVGTLCNGPLPVELSLFTATLVKNEINLFWKTETETNNFGFDVERTIDEKEWIKISFINGHGNSNSQKEYSFIDSDLNVWVNKFWYRLKQIDNSGGFEYSEVVEVEFVPDQYELAQNYPNPFNPTTTIRYSIPIDQFVTIKIYDVLGNEVVTLEDEQKPAGNYEVDFNASSLSSGVYFYKLQAGLFADTKKMTILK